MNEKNLFQLLTDMENTLFELETISEGLTFLEMHMSEELEEIRNEKNASVNFKIVCGGLRGYNTPIQILVNLLAEKVADMQEAYSTLFHAINAPEKEDHNAEDYSRR